MEDAAVVECVHCGRRFKVLVDDDTGRLGLVELGFEDLPEPLYLPNGSIRAVVTLMLALASWILLLLGREVPGYLLGLILTIVGYYFGLRKQMWNSQSRIFDASANTQGPLFLPTGFIRLVLIIGFVLGGMMVYRRGKLLEAKYLEFFVVLLGLVVGYGFARVLDAVDRTKIYVLCNHLNGAIVLCAGVYLFLIVMTGAVPDVRADFLTLALSCVISFYFGSRA
jgi:hypothetical protein